MKDGNGTDRTRSMWPDTLRLLSDSDGSKQSSCTPVTNTSAVVMKTPEQQKTDKKREKRLRQKQKQEAAKKQKQEEINMSAPLSKPADPSRPPHRIANLQALCQFRARCSLFPAAPLDPTPV